MTKSVREQLDHVEASIKRWNSRLRRSVTAIEKLEKRRKRLLHKAAEAAGRPKPVPAPKPAPAPEAAPAPALAASVTTLGDSLAFLEQQRDAGIPEFLRRGIAAQKAVDEVILSDVMKRDAEAAAAVAAEAAELKKRKTAGRIAKMKAKQSGETRKMPLSGKAALAAIRGDD